MEPEGEPQGRSSVRKTALAAGEKVLKYVINAISAQSDMGGVVIVVVLLGIVVQRGTALPAPPLRRGLPKGSPETAALTKGGSPVMKGAARRAVQQRRLESRTSCILYSTHL